MKTGLIAFAFIFSFGVLRAQMFERAQYIEKTIIEEYADWEDIDIDGDIDVIFDGYIFYNESGNLTANTEVKYGTDNEWIDYDGDGDFDIFSRGTRELYENKGDFNFEMVNSSFLENQSTWVSSSTRWGDFDKDGDKDLLYARDNSLILYTNLGQGIFQPIEINNRLIDWFTFGWGDYNSDGHLDFLVRGYKDSDKGLIIYENDGNGAFTTIIPTISEPYDVTIGNGPVKWIDYDGDGDEDLLCGTNIYENEGNAIFTYVFKVTYGSIYTANWADFDNDGDYDLVTSEWDNDELVVLYENTGSQFVESTQSFHGIGGKVTVKDLNNDGLEDVIAVGDDDNDGDTPHLTRTYLNQGNLTFTEVIPVFYKNFSHSWYWPGGVELWDIDQDQDLDIVPYSLSYGTYLNSGSEMVKVDYLQNLSYGSWEDYDNDGDLDYAGLYGPYTSDTYTRILSNNGQNNLFQLIADLPGMYLSSYGDGMTNWFDLDNDGDKDLMIIGGHSPSNRHLEIFENNGNSIFENRSSINNQIPWFSNGSVSFGDYNKDGFEDVFVAGEKDWNDYQATLLINIGDSLVESGFNFPAKEPDYDYVEQPDWGDYDNDGDLDLLFPDSLYINVDTAFLASDISVIGRKWIDFDNDGDLDIISAQQIFENDGAGNYTVISEYEIFPDDEFIYADIDKDGYIDVLNSGVIYSLTDEAKLSITPNSPPSAPENPVARGYNGMIKFSWDPGSDNGMSTGLLYNIRIGTTPGGNDIVNSYSSDTFYQTARPGNTGINTFYILNNPDVTSGTGNTYYWSVQSMDHGYLVSEFTQEQSFSPSSPDLIVNNITTTHLSDAPRFGESEYLTNEELIFNVSATNQEISINQGNFTTKVYLSLDNIYDASDALLLENSSTITTLEENTWLTLQDTILLDQSLPSGQIYIIAITDTGNEISETVEGNNTAVYPFTIQADNTGPEFLSIQNDDTYLYGDSVAVTAVISDNVRLNKLTINYAEIGLSDYSQLEIPTQKFADTLELGIPTLELNTDSGISFFLEAEDINGNITTSSISNVTALPDEIPPVISDFSYPTEITGPVEISASISDNAIVNEVNLYYKGVNQSFENAKKKNVTLGGNGLYEFTLANTEVSSLNGLIIYLTASDGFGNLSSTDTIRFSINDNKNYSFTIPGGSEVKDYHLVSVPLDLNLSSFKDVFEELGETNEHEWRMFQYKNGNTTEFSGPVKAGDGYWLISRNDKTIEFSTGKTVTEFTFNLGSGWNLIGNPYTYPISWNSVLAENGSPATVKPDLYYVESGAAKTSQTMEAFQGYFVYTDNAVSLTYSGISSSGSRINDNQGDLSWFVPITAIKGDYSNETAGIGMSVNSESGIDFNDGYNLPRFIKYIDVQSKKQSESKWAISKDIVDIKDNQVWPFDIQNNIEGETLTIEWDIPNEFEKELYLLDIEERFILDMKRSNNYTYDDSGSKEIEIYYGDISFIEQSLNIKEVIIGNVFPNPSNGLITIPFFVPDSRSYELNLFLYDSKGRVVGELIGTSLSAGFKNIQWNLNDIEIEMSDRLYLLRVNLKSEGGNKTFGQKIILR